MVSHIMCLSVQESDWKEIIARAEATASKFAATAGISLSDAVILPHSDSDVGCTSFGCLIGQSSLMVGGTDGSLEGREYMAKIPPSAYVVHSRRWILLQLRF